MTEGGKRVDEDWKRRAQAEKEIDAAKAAPAPAPGAAAAPRPDVKANPMFRGLIESLASQALLYMGAMRIDVDPFAGVSGSNFENNMTDLRCAT